MGFGNVLLKFTNLEGYLLSLKSQGSGSGKSTLLNVLAPEVQQSVGEISGCVNLVTIGLMDPLEFSSEILKITNFPKEKVNEIIDEINIKIFDVIKKKIELFLMGCGKNRVMV